MMSKTLRVVYIGKQHDFQVPITIQIGVGSWQKMNCRPRWFYRKILVSIKKNFTDRFAIWRQNGDAAHFSNQNLKILKISLFLKVGLHSDRSWSVKNGYFREESLKTFQALKSSSLARFLLKVDPDTCACFIFTSATRWYALESDWGIESLSANAQQEELGLEQSIRSHAWYSFLSY